MDELLSIYGIGPETADDIVLYAAHKPSFVIDAYTRRIVDRLGFLGSRIEPRLLLVPVPVSRQSPDRRASIPGVPCPAGPPRQGILRQNPALLRLLPPGSLRHRPGNHYRSNASSTDLCVSTPTKTGVTSVMAHYFTLREYPAGRQRCNLGGFKLVNPSFPRKRESTGPPPVNHTT